VSADCCARIRALAEILVCWALQQDGWSLKEEGVQHRRRRRTEGGRQTVVYTKFEGMSWVL
jgi:predicted RNA binding protein YcfA (HicA-like mRNA interferase family)